jgi:asparagine synthase (glutamine-hydrolysing)
MCGIAGWFGTLSFGDTHAEEMARRLRHRGPDAKGLRRWKTATFIHARLSIIDLTPTGEQPLGDESGRVWTIFNGEIYNHHQLRDELESHGHRFRGRADSEVLPHLYEQHGRDHISKLRGMFAFATYDSARQRLLLARDRFGIKPLFYALLPDGVVFASELRALLCLPGVDLSVDEQALYDYTALTYVPAPQTFYKGIRVLEPGCALEAELTGGRFRHQLFRYHQWAIQPDPSQSLGSVVDHADRLVGTAVRSQLESDVPIGALLSGGIDSSLVSTAAQAALAPDRLHTFNVRFPDVAYDETWAAHMVAESIGSQHRTLEFEAGGGTWDEVCGLLVHAGQPFADTSMFAVNSVSRLMRSHVKVALSGDGGDEAFGGYDLYWQLDRLARVRAIPPWALAAGRAGMRAAGMVSSRYSRWADRLGDFAAGDEAQIVGSLFRWVRDQELHSLLPDRALQPVRRHFEKKWEHLLPKDASRVERLSAHATEVNVRLVLPDDFLFKVDIASMRESLEVRVPMLDEDLVALGLSLPHRLKVRKRTGKLVLRELAARKLPEAVARKPKWGFGVPVDLWLGSEFRDRLRDTLLSSHTPLADHYDPKAYRPIIEAFYDHRQLGTSSRQGLYQRVTMLLAVHLTLEALPANRRLPADESALAVSSVPA